MLHAGVIDWSKQESEAQFTRPFDRWQLLFL